MAVTLYCGQSDVEFLWSNFGVALRIDDQDTGNSATRMGLALEKASADINWYLFQKYPVASLSNNAWVKWCAATICAVELARRRGNAPPPAMAEEYTRYIEALKAIQLGQQELPSDTGLAAPRFDNLPMYTNLRVDSRYTPKIRRDSRSSTRTPQAPTRQGNDATTPYYFW